MASLPKVSNPVAAAIRKTEFEVATVRSEVRKRKKWSIIRDDVLMEWANSKGLVGTHEELAVQFFERPAGTPVRSGSDISTFGPAEPRTVYAVWNGEGEPDIEPQF